MSSNVILVASIAFWVLAALTVFLPVRWSVVAFLLLIQFDVSAAGIYSSTTSVGFENAIKTLLVPSVLLLRMRPIRPLGPRFSKMCRYWLMFCAYAALAALWSPYKLSAIKMVAYLYAYSILFLVFSIAWRRKWITAGKLTFLVWMSLFFAYVQTYLLGNVYGEPEYGRRFTSFTGAQSFAPFLLILVVLLLFRERRGPSIYTAVMAAAIGISLTGSRSTFLGFAWVLLVLGGILAIRSGRKINFWLIVRSISLGLVGVVCISLFVSQALPKDRMNEMLNAVVSRNATLEDVGTFAWRYSLYQKILAELATRSLPRLLVGSGTSSGASLVLESGIFQERDVDPNRSLHDEFLRSAYEWGLPGLLLLTLFLVEAFRICGTLVIRYHSWQAGAFAAILMPLMLSLIVENILAESSAPVGAGFCLVLAGMAAITDAPKVGRTNRAVKPRHPADIHLQVPKRSTDIFGRTA